MTVVPWLWFLTQNANFRIFQEMAANEVIEAVFQAHGFSDYEIKLSSTPPTREYWVQFRETDFDFVSRLMEKEGLFYYFEHDNGSHKMVIADSASHYVDCDESEVDFPDSVGNVAVKDHLSSWDRKYRFITGSYTGTDYNFQEFPARQEPCPADLLKGNEVSVVQVDGIDKYERYEYPGAHVSRDEGRNYARLRTEEGEAAHDTVEASSTCKSFRPGGKFKIGKHRASAEEGGQFVITSISHRAVDVNAYETNGETVEHDYENKFSCIPANVVYRPPRTTPKPVVNGIQPAVVTGPPGEEIYCDEFGRVKVQFFWDREGQRDDNTTCWVRVSQIYAGQSWGGMCIPRIGQEVLIDFLDGDPDRPVIVGRVYNADQMPPYPLPDGKNISGLKSNSTPGGGGYNEMIFDDTKGNELIRIHGQYNMATTVENDQTSTIHHNRTDQVDADDSETVGGNQTLKVVGTKTDTVEKAVTETYNDVQHTTVTKEIKITSTSNQVHVFADTEIKLHVGQSEILMKKDGTIEIKGKDIFLNGTASINLDAPKIKIAGTQETMIGVAANTVKSDPSGVTTSGSMITASAQGTQTITGALVKIN